MQSNILPHLFIGDSQDAKRFKGHLICVLEGIPEDEPPHAVWVPVFETHGAEVILARQANLDAVCQLIRFKLIQQEDTMVHCGAGMERSPLVVTWFLHKHGGMGLNEAFEFVKNHHPASQNRLHWLREPQP